MLRRVRGELGGVKSGGKTGGEGEVNRGRGGRGRPEKLGQKEKKERGGGKK